MAFIATGIVLGALTVSWGVALTIVSISYQLYQSNKMRRKADAAAEARKGFEVVLEADVYTLPVVYGRAKVGGVRVYHNTRSAFDGSGTNAEKTLVAGPVVPSLAGSQTSAMSKFTRGELGTWKRILFADSVQASGVPNVRDLLDGEAPLSIRIGLLVEVYQEDAGKSTAMYDSIAYGFTASYRNMDALGFEVKIEGRGGANETVGPWVYLVNYKNENVSATGSKNEYLFFQQALCLGGISACHDLIVNDSIYRDDSDLYNPGKSFFLSRAAGIGAGSRPEDVKKGLRADVHYAGSKACGLMTSNFSERGSAKFTNVAYATVVIKLDRDDPQLGGQVPQIQFLVEGKKMHTVIKNGDVYSLSDEETYTNNPAYCLLDYLRSTVFGASVSLLELDLKSFYDAAQLCNKVVKTSAPVGGHIWQPIRFDSDPNYRHVVTRDIPLYECNIMIDTKKPIRENVENILGTMSDARLVWASGQYKLVLDYPETNAAINVVEEITDDDLILGRDVSVDWPSADSRLNFCTVRFNNETLDFKEDTVSWPPKVAGIMTKGVGAGRYPIQSGWDASNAYEIFMNSYAVWVGAERSSTSMSWVIYARQSGTYSFQYAADDSGTLTINGQQFAANKSLKSGSINLVAGNKYTFKFTGVDSGGGKRGCAALMRDPTGLVVWTTRDTAFSDIIVLNRTTEIYDAMLAEDSGVVLESDTFVDSITDYYHALAKAEATVRFSRSAFTVEFSYVIKETLLEPGNIIKFSSERVKLGTITDVYLRVDEVTAEDGYTATVKATRFDYTQLAWNVADDEYIRPGNAYDFSVAAPSSLTYIAGDSTISGSVGRLEWPSVDSTSVSSYALYFHKEGDFKVVNTYYTKMDTTNLKTAYPGASSLLLDHGVWNGSANLTYMTWQFVADADRTVELRAEASGSGWVKINGVQYDITSAFSTAVATLNLVAGTVYEVSTTINSTTSVRGFAAKLVSSDSLVVWASSYSRNTEREPVYTELGRTPSSPYYLPALAYESGTFGVRSVSKAGTLSSMTVTAMQLIMHRSKITVDLTASAPAFVREPNGATFNPSSITLTASSKFLANPMFVWRDLNNGNLIKAVEGTLQTSTSVESYKYVTTHVLSPQALPGAFKYGVEIYNKEDYIDGGQNDLLAYDEVTIFRLDVGVDAYFIDLGKENYPVRCKGDGTPYDSQLPFTVSAVAWNGSSLVEFDPADPAKVGGVYFGVTSSEIDFESNSATRGDLAGLNNGHFNITGFKSGHNQGVITVRGHFPGTGIDITRAITVYKVIDGVDGYDPPYVILNANSAGFVVAKNTGAVSPSNVVYNAEAVNITNPQYRWFVGDASGNNFVEVPSTVGTPSQFILQPFTDVSAKTIKVAVKGLSSSNALVDVYDIASALLIREGTDSVSSVMENQVQQIRCDHNGVPLVTDLVIESKMIVAVGQSLLPDINVPPHYRVRFSYLSSTNASGLNVDINESAGDVRITGVDKNTHPWPTFTFQAVIYKGNSLAPADIMSTVTATLRLFKINDGTPGFTASSVTLQADELLFIRYKDGTFSQNPITINATVQNIPNPVYVWTDTSTGSTVTKASSSNPNAHTYSMTLPAEPGSYNVSVEAYSETDSSLNTARDSLGIPYWVEGSDAVGFFFKDSVLQLSADATGLVEGGVTSATNHIIGGAGSPVVRILATPSEVVYTVDSTVGCSATMGTILNGHTRQFTITGDIFSSASVSNAKVTIRCTFPDGSYILQSCTIVKVKQGVPGVSPKVVSVQADTAGFLKARDGTISPATVNLTAVGKNLSSPSYRWLLDGVVQAGTGATLSISKETYLAAIGSGRALSILVEAYEQSSLVASDTDSIYFLIDGDDAFVPALSNENQTIPCDPSGNPISGSTSVLSRFFLVRGLTILSSVTSPYSAVFAVNQALPAWVNETSIINPSTGVVSFTVNNSMPTSGTIEFKAMLYNNGVATGSVFTKTLTLNKSKDGASPVNVSLSSSGDAFTINSAGNLSSANSITLTAVVQNSNADVAWSSSPAVILTGAGNTRNLSYANFGDNTAVTITATVGGVSDYVTVVKLKDGSDSITALLSNEAHNLPSDSAGNVTSYAGASSTMTVYRGASNISASCSYVTTATGCTISGANSRTVTVTALSQDVAYVDIEASFSGSPIATKRFTITKSKAGANGTAGSAGPKTTTGYVYYTSSSSSAPATPTASSYNFTTGAFTGLPGGWSTSINITGQGTFWAARYVVTETAAGSGTGVPSISAPFNHTNFSGLVTFSDQATALSNYTETWKFQSQGYTTIHGGNITTGTIAVDRLSANSATTSNGVTFGLGYGSAIFGISCAGYFRTTNSGTAALGVNSVYSVGLAASTGSSSSYAALFSNTFNVDTISSAYVVTGATIGAGNFGLFTQRKGSQGNSTSAEFPSTATACYAKLAYLEGTTHFGGRIMSTDLNGNDVRGVVIGGSYSIQHFGPTGPFTGAHDAFVKDIAGIEPGDILCDVQVLVRKDVSDTITEVALSSTPGMKSAVGVYCHPGEAVPLAMEIQKDGYVQENGAWKQVKKNVINPQYEHLISDYDHVIINSLGEGQINICGEGGDLEIGDLIMTSSMPGKGMKQADDIIRSCTVAKVRENVTFSSPTEVKMVSCIYVCG